MSEELQVTQAGATRRMAASSLMVRYMGLGRATPYEIPKYTRAYQKPMG